MTTRLPRNPLVANVDLGEPYDVYVGRNPKWGDTRWGNWAAKYAGRPLRTPGEQAAAFEADFLRRPGMAELARKELAGKILGCHCARRTWSPPCHAAFLARVANSPPEAPSRQPRKKNLSNTHT